MKNIIFLVVLFAVMGRMSAQTNVSAGAVSGTWQKSGSPYRVNGNVYVASGQKLIISSGVVVEFQGNFKMDVWGVIQALGKAKDTVVFTAKDKTNGWTGIWVHKQAAGNDSIIFDYCKIEYRGLQTPGSVPATGSALSIDTARKVRISNCLFTRNRSFNAAAGNFRYCAVSIWKTALIANEALNKDPNIGFAPSPGFQFLNCRVNLISCNFINNSSFKPISGNFPAGGILSFMDSVTFVSQCYFYNNGPLIGNTGSSCIYLSGVTKNSVVQNCHLINNRLGVFVVDAAGYLVKNILLDSCFDPIYITNTGNRLPFSGSRVTFDSLVIKKSGKLDIVNNVNNNPMNMIFNKLKMFNSEGIFVSIGVSNVDFNNCILANNSYGMKLFKSKISVYNSAIINNMPKSKSIVLDSLGSGILFSDDDIVLIYNSIISGNRNANGIIKNFEVEYEKSPGELQLTNCILEGGKSSITNLKSGVIKKYSNVIEVAPQFVNASAGAGNGYDATMADWRPLNTCSILSNTFNAGTNLISGYTFPAKDLDGNKRIANNLVDIGPYEIQKPRIPVLLAEPRDSSICANQTIDYTGLSATADSLQYRWQSSSNGSTWTNMTAQTYPVLYNFKPGTAGVSYLRCIISNPLCSKSDTTRSIKVTALPVPQPSLGPDASIANNSSKLLNPGTFNSYTWSTGATSPTLTVDKNNLTLGANSIWVQVKDANNCQNRDTVIITLEPASRLQSPQMAGIRVFPVPTDGVLNILLPTQSTGTWQLTTTDGRLLQMGILSKNTAIDMKTLPAGIYLLSMEVEGKVYGMRVVR
jgi:hypothetical protein